MKKCVNFLLIICCLFCFVFLVPVRNFFSKINNSNGITHKQESYHTMHTDLFCHMGFMPKLEVWPTSIIFLVGLELSTSAPSLLSVSVGGCQYYVKCETVLSNIDGEINMGNCGYFAKWGNEDGGDCCYSVDSNVGCHEFVPLSSRDRSNSTLPTSKTLPVTR